MGTGILYAVIVLAWAVYLIPIVRAHRQEAAVTRSADRFADAMRVLGRRSSGPRSRKSARLDAPPPRTRPRALVVVDTVDPSSGGFADSGPARGVGHTGAGRPGRTVSAASRRRRALAAIVGVAVVLGVLGYVGLVQWWALAVPAVLLVAFVLVARVSLRHQRAHRGLASSRTAGRVTVAPPSPVTLRPAAGRRGHRKARRVDAGGSQLPAAADVRVGIARPDDLGVTVIAAGEPVTVGPSAAVSSVVAAAAGPADAASAWLQHAELDRWDPVPVTLPTYVDKEQAQPRSIRTIDLSGPDAFSAGRLPEAELLTRPAANNLGELVERAGPDRAGTSQRGDDGETRVAAGA